MAPHLKRKKASVAICPGFSQDRVTFCSSQDRRFFFTTSFSLLRVGGGKALWGEGVPSGPASLAERAIWYCLLSSGFFSMWIASFLMPSVISTVSVTDLILISLLFTVNCSYLKPWSFVPPVLISSDPQEGRGMWWQVAIWF